MIDKLDLNKNPKFNNTFIRDAVILYDKHIISKEIELRDLFISTYDSLEDFLDFESLKFDYFTRSLSDLAHKS